MKMKRFISSATEVGNKIFFIGGWFGSKYIISYEVFDLFTNTWSFSYSIVKEERRAFLAVTIDNKMYIVRGEKNLPSILSMTILS